VSAGAVFRVVEAAAATANNTGSIQTPGGINAQDDCFFGDGTYTVELLSGGEACAIYGHDGTTYISLCTGSIAGAFKDAAREFYACDGTHAADAVGFYNTDSGYKVSSTQVVGAQQNSTGQTAGFTAGTGNAVKDDSTFTGGAGATAYTIGDIVKHLKTHGLLAG
jgi:hypothetical protein